MYLFEDSNLFFCAKKTFNSQRNVYANNMTALAINGNFYITISIFFGHAIG